MRNLSVIVCLVLGMIVYNCSAVPSLRRRRKSDAKLKSFTDRYALPTNVHSITSKLPLTYGYRFTDDYGTMQSREEKTDPNGSKTGSYSFVDATGLYRRVEYVADHHGFRATVTTNEPGTISVDPAHVRMLTDNKHISLGATNHATGITPQLEYSSHIFSRYNLTDDFGFDDRNSPTPVRDLDIIQKPLVSKSPVFESERSRVEDTKFFNINPYKGSPVKFSPEISSLLQQLDDPAPAYGNSKNLNSNNYYNEPNVNPDYNFNDEVSNKEYQKKVPTRYPRRHRNSRVRTKKGQALRIHIPKGFEDHPDLPLYRDK